MTNPLDFTGKRVLVIGGSSGIGNGIAHGFRAAGAEVSVTGTRPDAGDYLEAEDSDFTGIAYERLDVSERGVADALATRLPALDVLVLCQGAVRYGREEFAREGWDAVVAVNLTSVMDCARAFQPGLAARGGTIIVVSSTGAFHAMIGNPAYALALHVTHARLLEAGVVLRLMYEDGPIWVPSGPAESGDGGGEHVIDATAVDDEAITSIAPSPGCLE